MADGLSALINVWNWRVPAVTLGATFGLLMSALANVLIPQRYILTVLPLALVAIQTRPARALADIHLGIGSYLSGSLARTPWAPRRRGPGRWGRLLLKLQRREAATADGGATLSDRLSTSAVIQRAAVLPAYDVVTDTALDAMLARPL